MKANKLERFQSKNEMQLNFLEEQIQNAYNI